MEEYDKQNYIRKGLNIEEEKEKRIRKEKNRQKSLEDRIRVDEEESVHQPIHKIEIQLVSNNSIAYKERELEEYELFKVSRREGGNRKIPIPNLQRYQETIHKDDDVTQRGFDRFLVKTPLTSTNP